jgi:hypothetical protein
MAEYIDGEESDDADAKPLLEIVLRVQTQERKITGR